METLIKEMTQELLRESPEHCEYQHVDFLLEYVLSRIDVTNLFKHPEESREISLGVFESQCLDDLLAEHHTPLKAIFKVLNFISAESKWVKRSDEEEKAKE